MKKLTNSEMVKIKGGASYTSAINALLKAISSLFNIGQAVGSAIRRSKGENYCKV